MPGDGGDRFARELLMPMVGRGCSKNLGKRKGLAGRLRAGAGANLKCPGKVWIPVFPELSRAGTGRLAGPGVFAAGELGSWATGRSSLS